MQPPRPTAEIIVKVRPPHLIHIYTASPDAARWVAASAPQFGRYAAPDASHTDGLLVVDPTYDIAEVGAYLRTLGVTDSAPPGPPGVVIDGRVWSQADLTRLVRAAVCVAAEGISADSTEAQLSEHARLCAVLRGNGVID